MNIEVAWGEQGLRAAAISEAIVIVDVLSFSTAVDAACSRGAKVYPFVWKDARASAFAATVDARLATARQDAGDRHSAAPSLSPPSLKQLQAGERLVLPSPNGSTLASMAAEQADVVVAGALRNAGAVAAYLQDRAASVLLVAAGERWPDDSLRPALEDWLGVGALACALVGAKSPDARAASAAFQLMGAGLDLRAVPSGLELIERGFGGDVDFAAQLDVSSCVPALREGAFVDVSGHSSTS